MKLCGGGGRTPRILNLGTRWRSVVSFMFMSGPREKAPGTHWTEGRTGPRACLDALEKTEAPYPSSSSALEL